METEQAEQLREVLVGYFGAQSREDGVHELLQVVLRDEGYGRRYRNALETGLAAARAGDPDALPAVRELAPFLPDLDAAVDLLEGILAEWDRQAASL